MEAGLATYRARYSAVAIYDCTIYPGVPEMLDALRASGFVLCIATSKRRDFAERVIDYLGLGGRVPRHLRCRAWRRPGHKDDLLAHILRREGFSPEHTVMLGDRLHDIHAAKANALRSIGAGWGYGGEAELLAAGADAIAATPRDVPGLVQ